MSEFDQRVAELPAWTFDKLARDIARAMAFGDGLAAFFQPGDATRYSVLVGRRRVATYSSPDEDQPGVIDETLMSLSSVTIGFGTGDQGNVQRVAWGHIRELQPAHPWTDAVWRRLLDCIRRELEE